VGGVLLTSRQLPLAFNISTIFLWSDLCATFYIDYMVWSRVSWISAHAHSSQSFVFEDGNETTAAGYQAPTTIIACDSPDQGGCIGIYTEMKLQKPEFTAELRALRAEVRVLKESQRSN
jgi:hypothetical protein